MSDFFAAVAQTVATVLSILATVVVAFLVFQAERRARHQDEIDESVAAIREVLVDLKREWSWTGTATYLPPTFGSAFRARHPGMTRLNAAVDGAIELLIDSPNVGEAYADVVKDFPRWQGGPSAHWRGPIYVWLLRETVYGLSGGEVSAATEPERFFPFAADGSGFEEWRQGYLRAGSAFNSLLFDPERFVGEYVEFQKELLGNVAVPADFVLQRVASVKSAVVGITKHLKIIDKQRLLMSRYDSTLIHSTWILALLGIGFVTGVLIPLQLMTWNREFSSIGGSALLSIAWIPTLAALVLMIRGALWPSQDMTTAYVRQRWAPALRAVTQDHDGAARHAGILDSVQIEDATMGADGSRFPADVRVALETYLAKVTEYNTATRAFLGTVESILKGDDDLGPALTRDPVGPGLSSSPAMFLDDAEFASVVRLFGESPRPIGIGWLDVNVVSSLGAISERPFVSVPGRFTAALTRVRDRCRDTPEASAFLTARAALGTARSHLLAHLDSLSPKR